MPTQLAFVLYASLALIVVGSLLTVLSDRWAHRGFALVCLLAGLGFVVAAAREGRDPAPRTQKDRPSRG